MPPTPPQPRSGRLYAIALMCAAVSLFAVLDTMAKYLSTRAGLPVAEIVFVRFLSNVLLNIMMFGPLLALALARSRHRRLHALRSLFMAATTGFNFIALQYLQLDQTVTVFFIAPFIVAALGGPLLGETIGWRRLGAILVGFTGVLFVTRPGFGGVHPAILYAFCAAMSYALYALSTRYLTRLEAASLVQFSGPLAGAALFLPPALRDWVWPDNGLVWLLLVGMGFVGGFGHWLLVLAHRHAPAPDIAPFAYFGLPSMIGMGFLVFGDVPDGWTLLGASIIISAGVYLLWRERNR